MYGVNRRELTFKALAGLAGGAAGWLPVELASHNRSLFDTPTPGAVIANFLSMAILAGLVGGAIVASEAQQLEITPAVKRRFIQGFIICAFFSLPANYLANLVFTFLLNASGAAAHQISIPALIFARVVGWGLLGLMLGAGVGVGTFTMPNVLKGAAGGWFGGFVGGLAFDIISASSSGLTSRRIGFSAIGLCIGLFIGLVQELTKVAWLKVEAGRLRGREYRLERAASFVGRAEECEVGLFGDPGVVARHARIDRNAQQFFIKDLSHKEGTFLNGARVESGELHEGDRIKVSDYELSFHLRRSAGAGATLYSRPAPLPRQPAPEAVATGSMGPRLIDDQGRRMQLNHSGVTRIGRALDNDIVVEHNSVSRHHASIAQLNGAYHLNDLDSQNGTFLGGQRVKQAQLSDGDAIRLGDAQLTFRS